MGRALSSAQRSVQKAIPGVRIVRVEPDDLVDLKEIARRTGRSLESIRLLEAPR